MAKKKNTASVKDARDNRPLIVQQIVVKAPQRRVYDVGDWRAALRSADAGKAKYLYDLFDDIMIDGVLSNAVDKRIQAVLNAEVAFMDARGKENDAVARLLDTTAWETLVHEIMNRRFYGRAAVELSFRDGFAVEAIKPKYIDLHNHRILLDDSGMTGVSYDGDSHMLVLGRPDDFGLLLKAAPYAIWKRGGFGDYAQWIELFGMPQRIGKYNTYDPASRRLLEEAFEKAGSAPYIVIPKESEIETRDGNTGVGIVIQRVPRGQQRGDAHHHSRPDADHRAGRARRTLPRRGASRSRPPNMRVTCVSFSAHSTSVSYPCFRPEALPWRAERSYFPRRPSPSPWPT